jgi:hypothetical protein
LGGETWDGTEYIDFVVDEWLVEALDDTVEVDTIVGAEMATDDIKSGDRYPPL